MNRCITCGNDILLLPINLGPFAPHEKLAFVERVCGILIESRFGSGRTYETIADRRHTPDKRSDELPMLTAEGFTPPNEICLFNEFETGRTGRRGVEVRSPVKQPRSPSTLGRGSPNFRRAVKCKFQCIAANRL